MVLADTCAVLSVSAHLPSHNVSWHFSHKSQLHKECGLSVHLAAAKKSVQGRDESTVRDKCKIGAYKGTQLQACIA